MKKNILVCIVLFFAIFLSSCADVLMDTQADNTDNKDVFVDASIEDSNVELIIGENTLLKVNAEILDVFNFSYSEIVSLYGEVYNQLWYDGLLFRHKNLDFWVSYTDLDYADNPMVGSLIFSIVAGFSDVFIGNPNMVLLDERFEFDSTTNVYGTYVFNYNGFRFFIDLHREGEVQNTDPVTIRKP